MKESRNRLMSGGSRKRRLKPRERKRKNRLRRHNSATVEKRNANSVKLNNDAGRNSD